MWDYFPGPTLFDGDGTARLYIDDGASAEQCRELEAIFQAKKGGPWAILGGLITTPGTGTQWSDPDLPHRFEHKSGAVAAFTWRAS